MKFTRRTFLQGASLSLATLGGFFNDVILSSKTLNRYNATLAQSTPRKLALLIGINQYSQGSPLRGCLTDVELQKELLINRFQFQPTDIVSLTNKQATRSNIFTAFEEHLIKQVKNNDVVVIHFSGYGRQISISENNITNSLMTHDSLISGTENHVINDILFETLIGLCQLLKTNKYTLVLDSSYQPPSSPIPDKFWIRSYFIKDQQLPSISEEELSFNQQFSKPIQSNQIAGLILSTSNQNLATEITSNNFNAGLFTYCLTQSLWQSFPENNNLTVGQNVNSQIALSSFSGGKVHFYPENKLSFYPYYLPVTENTKGEAIITKFIPPNNVELELLGLPLLVLSSYNVNSFFKTELNTKETIIIQINSLTGNKAKGIVINGNQNLISTGLIFQEYLRVINRNTGLRVALDNSLEKIEKVDATSALSAIGNIQSVVNLGDDFADCILGKFTNNSQATIDSYGLFSIAGILFPNTTAKTPHEAVSTAVKRIANSLENALAEKLLRLTVNQNASLLPVNINLEIIDNNKTFSTIKSTPNSQFRKSVNKVNQGIKLLAQNPESLLLNVSLNSQLTLTISNENNFDLYYLLFVINSSEQILAHFSPDNQQLTQGETISLPTNNNSLKWIVNSGKGISELIIICAKFPFSKTLNTLNKLAKMKPDKQEIITLEHPTIIANNILEDLHTGTNKNNTLFSNFNLSEVYALDLANWASFNFVYEIV